MTSDSAGQAPHSTETTASAPFPVAPDAMLGLWASWMENAFQSAQSLAQAGPGWWQLAPAGPGGMESVPGAEQLAGFLTS